MEADYRDVGEAAWSWVLSQVRDDDGPWLPDTVPDDQPPTGPAADRDSLYAGIAGLAPVLAEIGQSRALSDAEQHLADAVVARLSAQARTRTEASLYDGLAGDATALRMLAPGTEAAALRRLAEPDDPDGLAHDARRGRVRRALHRHRHGHRRRGAGRGLGRWRARRRRSHDRWCEALLARRGPHRGRPRLGHRPGRAVPEAPTTRTARPASRPRWPWPGRRWTARTSSRPRCRARSTCSPWARWTTAASSSRTPSRRPPAARWSR